MSPSGSLKKPSIGAVTVSPTSISSGGISPTASGAWLGFVTVTSAVCSADSPPGSVAVMVSTAPPSPTAVIVTSDPVIDAASTVVSEDSAA